MSKKELMINVLTGKPGKSISFWELGFHLWDKFGCGHLVLGEEYARLTEREKEQALYSNAEIFAKVCIGN